MHSIPRASSLSVLLLISLMMQAAAQESLGLPPQEILIGQRFEFGLAQDASARDYMVRFSDPQFFSSTSKLRKIWGQASVLSGDTLKIGKETIRLIGIRAPEISQTCKRNDIDLQFDAGGYALGALKTWARNDKAVICYVKDGTSIEGTCFIWGMPGPINIARILVREGAAWAYPSVSSPYVRDEGWAEGAASRTKDPAIRNLWYTDCSPPGK